MTSPVRYRIRHETVYEYAGDVVHAHELLHLAPRPCANQSVVDHSIHVRPEPSDRRDEVDGFGNAVIRLQFERPHRRLEVVADVEVEVRPRSEAKAEASEPWERVREALTYHSVPPPSDVLEACRFRMQSPYVRVKKAFAEYAKGCFPAGRPILEGAEALMRSIHADFEYAPGETAVGTPLLRVLAERRGVCQDFTHVMIACLRSFGLAARYVSGYVRTSAPGTVSATRGADASHAWTSVHCPPFGWVDLDPTNGARVDTEHVTIAWGRDFGDVSPLRGVITGGGAHTVSVKVSTTPEPIP